LGLSLKWMSRMLFFMVICMKRFICSHPRVLMSLQNMFVGFSCSYGLKQAPCAWFERFVSVLRAAGFSPSGHDPALFIHLSPRGRTLLLLYVADMLITGDNDVQVSLVKKH